MLTMLPPTSEKLLGLPQSCEAQVGMLQGSVALAYAIFKPH